MCNTNLEVQVCVQEFRFYIGKCQVKDANLLEMLDLVFESRTN